MAALLDQAAVAVIVAVAAAYVVWRVLLPVQVKTKIRYRLAGQKEPCAPQDDGCAGGCAGCAVAAPRVRQIHVKAPKR
jgi:hypothetical protein